MCLTIFPYLCCFLSYLHLSFSYLSLKGRWTFINSFHYPGFCRFSINIKSHQHVVLAPRREDTTTTILFSRNALSGLFLSPCSCCFSLYLSSLSLSSTFLPPSNKHAPRSFTPFLCVQTPMLSTRFAERHPHHQLLPSLKSTTCSAYTGEEGGRENIAPLGSFVR